MPLQLQQQPAEHVSAPARVSEPRDSVAHQLGRLEHPNTSVRADAAHLLGQMDDPRVVPALLKAFHRCFPGGSPWKQVLSWGVGTAVFGMTYLALLSAGAWAPGPEWLVSWVGGILMAGLLGARVIQQQAQRRNSRVVEAITRAMVSLAERHSSPELSGILGDLQVVGMDRYQQNPETRAAAKEARTRLTELLADVRRLPVISAPSPENDAELPRPASAPDQPAPSPAGPG
jgi:hypothetical protein